MIYLDYPNKERIAATHYKAVKDYVMRQSDAVQNNLYTEICKLYTALPKNRRATDYSWLRRFILADHHTLDYWTKTQSNDLKDDFFKKLYLNHFAKDSEIFVDKAKTYNAYALLDMIGFHVCPYCDEEYIDTMSTIKGDRRTCDIDHFHPKGKDEYPLLAMCFYNLIPSGKGCNQTMNITSIEANPYDDNIETWSKFVQDTPIGRLIDSLDNKELKIRLQTTAGMTTNNAVLAIEQRYNNRKYELRRILKLRELFRAENIEEKKRLGISEETLKLIFGEPYPTERGKTIHQKLKHDLLGF